MAGGQAGGRAKARSLGGGEGRGGKFRALFFVRKKTGLGPYRGKATITAIISLGSRMDIANIQGKKLVEWEDFSMLNRPELRRLGRGRREGKGDSGREFSKRVFIRGLILIGVIYGK